MFNLHDNIPRYAWSHKKTHLSVCMYIQWSTVIPRFVCFKLPCHLRPTQWYNTIRYLRKGFNPQSHISNTQTSLQKAAHQATTWELNCIQYNVEQSWCPRWNTLKLNQNGGHPSAKTGKSWKNMAIFANINDIWHWKFAELKYTYILMYLKQTLELHKNLDTMLWFSWFCFRWGIVVSRHHYVGNQIKGFCR